MRKLLLVAALACAAVAAWAPNAIASATCEHSGPPSNELRVTAFANPNIDLDFADGDVYRESDSIRVKTFDPVACTGPPATLAGTDRVAVLQHGLSFNSFSLGGGSLWPGGSPEADGTDETELSFVSQEDSLGYGQLVGTGAAESWVLGVSAGTLGVSLEPDRRHELDVLFEGTGDRIPALRLRGGNDNLAGSVPSFLGRNSRFALVFGGPGDDRLSMDAGLQFIIGGKGNDRISGGRGLDNLAGGPGKDRMFGGRGKDAMDARDGERDVVRCGPQRDVAEVDRKDNVKGCEKVKRA
jgi:Ca2+-binding RTX toxin-like protein